MENNEHIEVQDNWTKSPAAYRKYMETLKYAIKETEERMLKLEKMKKVSKFSYDEWVEWLNKGKKWDE